MATCAQGPMHIIYLTSSTYDLDDEGRLPADDPVSNYDWKKDHLVP